MKKTVVIFWLVILGVGSGVIVYERNPWGLGQSLRNATGFVTGWPPKQKMKTRQEILGLLALRGDLEKSGGDTTPYKNRLYDIVQRAKGANSEDVIYQIDTILFKDTSADSENIHSLKTIAMTILVELPFQETEQLLKEMVHDEPISNADATDNPLYYYNLMALKRLAIKSLGQDPHYLLDLIDEPDAPGMNHDIYLAVVERYISASKDPLRAVQDLRTRVLPGAQGVLDAIESAYTRPSQGGLS